MIVSTTNEYGELRSALVGAVDNFAWPVDDTAFNTDVYDNTEYSETGFINQPLSNAPNVIFFAKMSFFSSNLELFSTAKLSFFS